MTEAWRCPICDQLWENGELVDGLCPSCLIDNCLEEKRRFSGNQWGKAWDPPPIEELQPLFADYQILSLIGRGGMGAVYQAIQLKLNRRVAIKILPPVLGWNPECKERFLREAMVLAKLNTPGIVTIYDSGQSQDLYYLVMEHVAGKTLRGYAAENTMSPRQILELGIRLCGIMEIAHASGIVHRDLKPDNILVPSLEQVKIADFGVAKLFGEQHAGEAAPATTSSSAAGTGAFMAPEQRTRPDQADLRADIYSLGVILYLLLTGSLPGPEPRPPSQTLPGLGTHMDAVVMRAIEPDPAKRQQTMRDLRQELETVLANEKATEAQVAQQNDASAKRPCRNIVLWGSGAMAVVCLVFLACSLISPTLLLAKRHLPAAGFPFAVPLDDTVELTLRPIPAGKFAMGSPAGETPERHASEQLRQVEISKPFWMGECEVTQAQYRTMTGTNPAQTQGLGNNLPVEWVSWQDASRFCEALTGREKKAGRIPRDYLYRLPTEAEWEYAAKAGGKSVILTKPAEMAAKGWNLHNSGTKIHPVKQKQANAWGLYDLFGNVAEWCQDSWYERPGDVPDAVDPVWCPGTEMVLKVYRGGHFGSAYFRSAHRDRIAYSAQWPNLGFRVVLAPAFKAPPVQSLVPPACPALAALPPAMGKPYGLPLPRGTTVEMLSIPAGEFVMGSQEGEAFRHPSERQHLVKISTPFWMGRVEVTQKQYEAIMNSNPSIYRQAGVELPVENVCWFAAMEFCKRLSDRERSAGRLPAGMVYRLPTDAEWEYACRAGVTQPLSLVKNRELMDKLGWNTFNSEGHPHPVRQKAANAWGLQDMLGNVMEWCLDRSLDAGIKDGLVDPVAIQANRNARGLRIMRGGGFVAEIYQYAGRWGSYGWSHNQMNGFRIVLARAVPGADAEEPEDREAAALKTLPLDPQGFRKIPLTTAWWKGTGMDIGDTGIVIRKNDISRPDFDLTNLHMAQSIDTSQQTEISLTWQIGGVETLVNDANALNLVIALEAKEVPSLTLGQMSTARDREGFATIQPGIRHRTSLLFEDGPKGKLVLTLFRQDGQAETMLQRWEYPIDDTMRINLKHTQVMVQLVKGPIHCWLLCTETLIRQEDRPGQAPGF